LLAAPGAARTLAQDLAAGLRPAASVVIKRACRAKRASTLAHDLAAGLRPAASVLIEGRLA